MKYIKQSTATLAVITLSWFIPQTALAGRIPSGRYTPGPVDVVLEVRGNKFQEITEGGSSSWRLTSELTLVKNRVIKYRGSYFCGEKYPQSTKTSYVCTRNGWKAGSI